VNPASSGNPLIAVSAFAAKLSGLAIVTGRHNQ